MQSWVLALRHQIGIPHTLAELGVTEDLIPQIARMAVDDPTAPTNPVKLTVANLEGALRHRHQRRAGGLGLQDSANAPTQSSQFCQFTVPGVAYCDATHYSYSDDPTLTAMTRAALIIEDDQTLAELVRLHLLDVDCAADIADDGVTGLEMFKEGDYELVVLDIMLPRKDGLSVCRDIRRLPGYVPILMLTAKSTELDRVRGLEIGADDYMTKPFSVRELVARVKALLRRVDALSPETASDAENEVIDRGNMRIAIGKRRVTVDDEDITLTAKEFRPARPLCAQPGAGLQPGSVTGPGVGLQPRRLRAYRQFPHQSAARENRIRSGQAEIHPHSVGRRL